MTVTTYLVLGVLCNPTIFQVVLEMRTHCQTAIILLIPTVITIIMRLELDAQIVNGLSC